MSIEIDRADVEEIVRKGKKISEIKTKDGTKYHVITTSGDKFVCSGIDYESVSIPLSEVELIWKKSLNPALIFSVVLLSIGFVIGISALLRTIPT